jgi:hypothetical protein
MQLMQTLKIAWRVIKSSYWNWKSQPFPSELLGGCVRRCENGKIHALPQWCGATLFKNSSAPRIAVTIGWQMAYNETKWAQGAPSQIGVISGASGGDWRSQAERDDCESWVSEWLMTDWSPRARLRSGGNSNLVSPAAAMGARRAVFPWLPISARSSSSVGLIESYFWLQAG